MIYDCFPFNNELMLLEIRLNHHAPLVDQFVLTECPWTYSGLEKPLYYDEVKDKEPFVKFKDKIIHNIYDVPPNGKSNWEYEHDQRNSLRKINFNNDDLIIYADCDEIIRDKRVIRAALLFIDYHPFITLDMELHWYYFNCVIEPGSDFQNDYSMESCFEHRWRMAKIFSAKFINMFQNLYQIRTLFLWETRGEYTDEFGKLIKIVEKYNKGDDCIIKDAGWHFSNLGDPALIYKKICSFSHSKDLKSRYQLSAKLIEKRKTELRDPLGRDVKFIATDTDVPPYIIDNAERYSEYFINE